MGQFLTLSLLLCFVVIAQGQSPPLKSDTDKGGHAVTVSGGRSPSPSTPSPSLKTRPQAIASDSTADSTASANKPSPESGKKSYACSEELKEALAKTNSTLFKKPECIPLKTLVDDDGSGCKVNYGQRHVASWPNKIGTIWFSKPDLCCDLCRVMRTCYSWWWKNGRCHLYSVYTISTGCSNCAGGNI